MEIRLGSYVETLVEKNEAESVDRIIHLPKGLRGTVCDIEHLGEGWVYVEFSDESVLKDGTGVYDYELSEIKIIEY